MPAIVTQILLSIPLIGAYAMFALGISVIYRASRVLNLAHGAMAMVPAYVSYSLVQSGVPIGVALLVAVLFGAALGVGVEWAFVRRLRPQGPTAQTVGTVAVTGLLIALTAKIWGTTPKIAPGVFPRGIIHVGASGLRYGDIGLFVTGVVVSAALFTFFKRTEVGLAMRGAAQNRRAAALMGIDPDLAASAAWALGGGLAALAGVMLAAVTNLDPYTLSLQVLPAFVAALVGGLESLTGALWGSAVAGLAFGIVPYFSGTPVIGSLARYNGSPQLALAILTLVVMAMRGRRLAGAEASEAGLVTSSRPPAAPRRTRRLGPGAILAVAALVAWGFLVPFSVLGDSLLTIQLALAAMSIVILTGWVGQISLAQASFVGISSLVMGLVVRGWGIGFPLSIVISAAAAGAAAALLGVIALRVRGLYLAVATLVFAWMCDQFLFKTPWLGANSGSSTIPGQTLGDPKGWPFFDLTERRTLYFIFVAIAALAVFSLANLRDTKTGRAFFAVRGSEMAAASLGIDVVRTKLIAFAVAGALAGVSGGLLMLDQRTVVPNQFLFTVSLQYLAIAVVGGLGSLGGALGAGAVFAALNELFFRVAALSGWLEVVSASLLAVVLLAYPGGLIAVMEGARAGTDALRTRLRRVWGRRLGALGARLGTLPQVLGRALVAVLRPAGRLGARALRPLVRTLPVRGVAVREGEELHLGTRSEDWLARALAVAAPVSGDGELVAASGNGAAATPGPASGNGDRPQLRLDRRAARAAIGDRDARPAVLDAQGIVVRFGGLTAVADASIAVKQGEITGLIGPNGAGKTTLFNAILGLNDPASGRVRLFGHDATRLPPHLRAAMGVARTFQVLQVFSELTIFDNLLVATHLHNRSGLLSNLAAAPRTLTAEAEARERVRQVLKLLELEEVAGRGVRGLPFGVLRMVELGRALVTGAPLIMLDEPASGLNNAETDRLTEVVAGIRALGVSVLLIEHDVRMVAGVCDYVYVLDQGRLIAQGPPAAVQRDPQVVAAYLGAATVEEPELVS